LARDFALAFCKNRIPRVITTTALIPLRKLDQLEGNNNSCRYDKESENYEQYESPER
jgi:hypothetical protein